MVPKCENDIQTSAVSETFDDAAPKPKLLAIASAGGHWVQLQRLVPAWDEYDVVYVSTQSDMLSSARKKQSTSKFYTVVDLSLIHI